MYTHKIHVIRNLAERMEQCYKHVYVVVVYMYIHM